VETNLIGQTIDSYRLLEVLGKGGMGVVYKALDTALEREVALKMISLDLAKDELFLKRFRTEAKALAKLDDPHIVTIFALRETEIGLLMVMEFVDGITLAEMLRPGPIPSEKTLPMIKQILTALGHAHQVGIIHRDIKPSNVMITRAGEVKVTDFGLAKIQRGAETTITLFTVGTLLYMSPEQVKNSAQVDRRSDIFSLGMTFYEMLAGRTPFEKTGAQVDILNAIITGRFPPPEQFNSAVPPKLSQIVMQAIAADPARRFQNTGELLKAIAQFEAGEAALPPNANKKTGFIRVAVAAIALLAALALLSYKLFWSPPPIQPIAQPNVSTPSDSQRVQSEIMAHSEAIKKLAAIAETRVLNSRLNEYQQDMLISIGSQQDFDPLDGCYVFITDDQSVLGVFQFKDNSYYDVNSGAQYSTLPEQYAGKTAIWMKDYSVK